MGAVCARCGCWRGELGQEPTVERYIADLVSVFDAVRRVLRCDGLCWVNLSGSYFNNPGGQNGGVNNGLDYGAGRISRKVMEANRQAGRQDRIGAAGKDSWLKPLDWVDTPGLFAHAMQQPRATHCIKKEADRAWMAALVDGEGTIGIHKKGKPLVRQDGTDGGIKYVAYLTVANTDLALLERCSAITGFGSIRAGQEPGTDYRGIDNRLTCYKWRVDADKAIEVIRDIYPFLITKRRQAILANTLDCSHKETGALGPHKPVPHEVREKRALLKTLINACNQREGGIVIPDWCRDPDPVTIHPGWYWRADICLVKRSPLPESVQGTRWERCRVKVADGKSPARNFKPELRRDASDRAETGFPEGAQWADCPGCSRCAPNDGLILRRGNGRPTRSWERFLVFAKAPGAFWDSEAVREPMAAAPHAPGNRKWAEGDRNDGNPVAVVWGSESGRNLKDWQFWPTTGGVGGLQHFAAFPLGLPSLAIRAGTSEKCCGNCGAPWARVVERRFLPQPDVRDPAKLAKASGKGLAAENGWGETPRGTTEGETTGWRATCPCGHEAPVVPATVLDPFVGSGTTLIAADRLGRDALGIDVQPTYIDLAAGRAQRDAPLFADVEVERQAEQASKQRDLFSVLAEVEGEVGLRKRPE